MSEGNNKSSRLYLSWNDIEDICRNVAAKIETEQDSKFKPDILIGLSRGGLVPVRIFSDLLGVHDIYVLRVKSYNNTKKIQKPIIEGYNCNLSKYINGKNILVVDDVADSGESLEVVKEYLTKKYKPKQIKFATLHYKPRSIFKPDYFGDITDKWIVYPWEKEEAKM